MHLTPHIHCIVFHIHIKRSSFRDIRDSITKLLLYIHTWVKFYINMFNCKEFGLVFRTNKTLGTRSSRHSKKKRPLFLPNQLSWNNFNEHICLMNFAGNFITLDVLYFKSVKERNSAQSALLRLSVHGAKDDLILAPCTDRRNRADWAEFLSFTLLKYKTSSVIKLPAKRLIIDY